MFVLVAALIPSSSRADKQMATRTPSFISSFDSRAGAISIHDGQRRTRRGSGYVVLAKLESRKACPRPATDTCFCPLSDTWILRANRKRAYAISLTTPPASLILALTTSESPPTCKLSNPTYSAVFETKRALTTKDTGQPEGLNDGFGS